MIDRGFCRTMSRYNAWQNKALWSVIDAMDEVDILTDHLGPHTSVLGRLNRLLWIDQMWLSRLSTFKVRHQTLAESAEMRPTPATWWAERFRTDGTFRMWADTLSSLDLTGDMAFWSISLETDVIRPKTMCIMHIFNQQTAQRAQIRNLLAAAGQSLPPSDLFLLPAEEA